MQLKVGEIVQRKYFVNLFEIFTHGIIDVHTRLTYYLNRLEWDLKRNIKNQNVIGVWSRSSLDVLLLHS